MDLLQLLETNPVAGVAVIAILASVAGAIFKTLLEELAEMLKGFFQVILQTGVESLVTMIVVPDKSPFRGDLEVWLVAFRGQVLWRNRIYEQHEGEGDFSLDTDFPIRIGFGTKVLVHYKGWPVFISCVQADEDVKKPSIRVTTPIRDRRFLDDFMTSVIEVGKEKYRYVPPPNHLQIFYGTCEFFTPHRVPRRDLSSVILPTQTEQLVVGTIQEFIDCQAWYKQMGLPHRLGILLEGPPGSGKTSVAKALASHFQTDLHIVPLGSPTLDDDELLDLFTDIGHHTTFVLMEDLSALTLGSQIEMSDDDEGSRRGITLSGLLNAIDGALSPQHVIFIFTANYAEGLDEALTRFGRVDLRVKFEHATQDQARRLFLRFYPQHESLAGTFADFIPDRIVSMAEIQFELTNRKHDPHAAVAWAKMKRKETKTQKKSKRT